MSRTVYQDLKFVNNDFQTTTCPSPNDFDDPEDKTELIVVVVTIVTVSQ